MSLPKSIIAALDNLTIDSVDGNDYMYNYKTNKNEIISDELNDEKAMEYIPQDHAAVGLYQCYRKLGKSEWESVSATLSHVINAYQKNNPTKGAS